MISYPTGEGETQRTLVSLSAERIGIEAVTDLLPYSLVAPAGGQNSLLSPGRHLCMDSVGEKPSQPT